MAVKNKMSDLRNYLFEGMERLLDEDDKFGAKEGTALAQLGKAIVDSAKAQIQAAKLTGGKIPAEFVEYPILDSQPRQLSPNEFDKLG